MDKPIRIETYDMDNTTDTTTKDAATVERSSNSDLLHTLAAVESAATSACTVPPVRIAQAFPGVLAHLMAKGYGRVQAVAGLRSFLENPESPKPRRFGDLLAAERSLREANQRSGQAGIDV